MDLSNLSITQEEQEQANTKEEKTWISVQFYDMMEETLGSPSVPTHSICGHEGTLWPM